jgi:SAM-dependent methyltransferase
MDPLTDLGVKYDTDKSTFHDFTRFYEKHFKKFRNENINILELGIFNGGSLLMLEEYFPNANIYAIDIDANCIKKYGSRIQTYLCSQTDETKLQELFSDIDFDIIIDDGSHMTLHQLESLSFLFKKVKPGGLYVCEDLHTSLIKSYVNSETIPLHLFEKYDGTKLHVPEISDESVEYINNNLMGIEVYKKEKNAYKCYKCHTINNYEFENCKNCRTDLSPNNSSYTSIMFKK